MATMHMPLRNKGAEAWRPIEVTPLDTAVYRVEGPMPDEEEWAYPPGTLVAIRWKQFPDGDHRLIPTGPAPTVRSALADYYKRMAGMAVGILPLLFAIGLLPRRSEGPPEPVPLFVVCLASALVSLIGIIWLRPKSLIGQWALRSALGFGILFGLVSFAL